jgi:integrase
MAVYGLRFGEIRDLRMDDFDCENRVLTVRRGKNHRVQRFPLNAEVSHAIQKYISRARPVSNCPSLFITFMTPHRAVSHGIVYYHVSKVFRSNGVESLTKGPHAFRHACAGRLMKKGASVSEIAAFLGHNGTSSVRVYTRYDLKSLRVIAEFSLKGLL